MTSTANAATDLAAEIVAALLARNPGLVLGLPTGRTPVPFYRSLVALHRRGGADFARATTFNLDEFIGVAANHPGSYHAYMQRHLFDQVNLSRSRTHLPNGSSRDWRDAIDRYEATLARAGGLDAVVLGIGRNGHIGFNEPGDRLVATTHRVLLHAPTRRANAHLFGGKVKNVPKYALSMGLATILQARFDRAVGDGRRQGGDRRQGPGGSDHHPSPRLVDPAAPSHGGDCRSSGRGETSEAVTVAAR